MVGGRAAWPTLATAQRCTYASGEPENVLIDAIGLKAHGASEWLANWHGKRSWHKFYLVIDPGSG